MAQTPQERRTSLTSTDHPQHQAKTPQGFPRSVFMKTPRPTTHTPQNHQNGITALLLASRLAKQNKTKTTQSQTTLQPQGILLCTVSTKTPR
ncbi:hypothetical protein HYALB_00004185 [Hymenoscyphus albidus]|uniref:Uncharacterized protein n=1 Tax=Hymenoscyphus albidus TaxID=595503 RepID=A0A9N9M4Q4_9HELO|nr:hypothetical protein HYALB_00004185 [Hymenoscyphus albidus]